MPDHPTLTITPEPLTANAWAPFGWLPLPDTDAADGDQTLEFAWADAHVHEETYDDAEYDQYEAECSIWDEGDQFFTERLHRLGE